MRSLPVPLSPVMSTVVRASAMRCDQVEDAAHRLGADRGARAALLARELRPEALVLGDDRALLERLVHERAELGRRERLGDEVVGAALHGVDRGLEPPCAVITMTSVLRRCAAWRARAGRAPMPSGISRSVRTTAYGSGALRIASLRGREAGRERRRRGPRAGRGSRACRAAPARRRRRGGAARLRGHRRQSTLLAGARFAKASRDSVASFATAVCVSPAPTDTVIVFVRPWSVLTNFTWCEPGETETCTFGVVPSACPSRKRSTAGSS